MTTTPPPTTTPAQDAAARRVSAAVDAAVVALADAAAILETVDLPEAQLPDLAVLDPAREALRRAAMHSGERHLTAAAGMTGEPDWFELGAYDEYDDAWAVHVIEADERYPKVAVSAPSAVEANRRAGTWGNLVAGHAGSIPVDGPRQRLAGSGTREIAPGRWQVELENW